MVGVLGISVTYRHQSFCIFIILTTLISSVFKEISYYYSRERFHKSKSVASFSLSQPSGRQSTPLNPQTCVDHFRSPQQFDLIFFQTLSNLQKNSTFFFQMKFQKYTQNLLISENLDVMNKIAFSFILFLSTTMIRKYRKSSNETKVKLEANLFCLLQNMINLTYIWRTASLIRFQTNK